jgi:hypothetical protein
VATIARFNVAVATDISEFNRGLDAAENRAQGWAGRVGGFLSNVAAFAAGGLITNGIQSIGERFFGAATAGLSFNNSMEQVEAKLNAFTKDGAATADLLDMIRKRAASTPFEFEQMASAAASLLPAAKASGKGLEELIAQAEVLAASNPQEGLEGAAFALKEALSGDFTSVIERFNLPRQRLNELKAEGVPALQAIQTAMQELGLDASLVGNLAETAQGRWSTFKDTLVGLAATATAPIFEKFSSGLGQVNAYLTANQPAIEAFATSLASGIGTAISFIADTAIPAFIGAVSGLQAGLAPIVGFLGGWQPLLAGIGAMILGVIVVAFGSWAVAAGTAAVATIAATWPIIAVITAIGAAVALLYAAWQGNWGNIQGITASVWGMIQPILSMLWTWLSTTLASAITTLASFWTGTLYPALVTVGGWISANLIPFLNALGDVLSAVVGVAVIALAGLWQNVLYPALEAVWGFLTANVDPALNSTASTVSSILQPALEWLGGYLPTISGAFDGISSAIQGVTGWLSGLADKLRNLPNALPDWLTPGSPTPLEIAMWGLGNSFQYVARQGVGSLNRELGGLNQPYLPAPGGVAQAVAGPSADTQSAMMAEVAAAIYDTSARQEERLVSLEKRLADLNRTGETGNRITRGLKNKAGLS